MKQVYYKYGTRDLGCGCCSESDNTLEVYEGDETLLEQDWRSSAPTFSNELELRAWMQEFYIWPDDELEMHPDNEYL